MKLKSNPITGKISMSPVMSAFEFSDNHQMFDGEEVVSLNHYASLVLENIKSFDLSKS